MEDLNNLTPTEELQEASNVIPEGQKIIQITFSDTGLPNINYNNMTVPEILGTLELSKSILQSKTIGTPILQQHLYNIAQSIQ
jgi:hypothetical protein